MERELADREARGDGDFDGATLRDLADWYRREIGLLKRVTATQKGNLTRVVESLGDKVASKLQVADIVEHARRRCQGEHVIKDGKRIPACSPASMNVELGYLAEVLRVARSMGKLSIERDVVADARPTLRLVKLVGKTCKRDRRPKDDELRRLREHFDAQAWESKTPMVDIVNFAIATGKRDGAASIQTQCAWLRARRVPSPVRAAGQRFFRFAFSPGSVAPACRRTRACPLAPSPDVQQFRHRL